MANPPWEGNDCPANRIALSPAMFPPHPLLRFFTPSPRSSPGSPHSAVRRVRASAPTVPASSLRGWSSRSRDVPSAKKVQDIFLYNYIYQGWRKYFKLFFAVNSPERATSTPTWLDKLHLRTRCAQYCIGVATKVSTLPRILALCKHKSLTCAVSSARCHRSMSLFSS